MEQPTGKLSESDAPTRGDETVAQPSALNARPQNEREQIGPYRILQKMGEGGMGVVYKAEQREPVRRVVALKVIKLGMDTREVVARFEAERQALALMSHPNVAKVFEAGATDRGRPYFAMEFVPGIPITDYCDQNKLTPRQRLELFIPVCQAIQHAHQKGIIHRDLKPSNILVSMFEGQPVPKVIDFGIAKAANQALTEKTVYTHTGSLIGTPEYMSPEQALTSGLDVDTRTDVYALGVILYELLTGQLPFDATTLRKAGLDGIARIIRETEPAKPSTRLSSAGETADAKPSTDAARNRSLELRALQRELRGDLDWITLKAMEKDRTRRYETASGLAADIRRYLDDEPIVARPPNTLYRLRKVVRRHKLGVSAAALVLLALLLGVAGTTTEMIRARHAMARAQAAEQNAIAQTAVAEEQRTAAMENEAAADHNLARIYEVKGDYTKSLPLLHRALDINRALRGPENAEVAAALGELAFTENASGDPATAERTYLESLHMLQKLEGDHGPQVAAGLQKLGAFYLSSNRPDEAEPLLRRSLELYRAEPASPPEGLASALGDLGTLLYRKGNTAAAEPLLRESLSTWEKFPGYTSYVSYDIASIAQTLWKLRDAAGDKPGTLAFVRQYELIQIAHISMGIAASPNDTSFLRARASMYGDIGRFSQMAADLDKLLQLTPDEPLLYMQAASVHLYLGEDSAYRDICQRMYQRFARIDETRVHDRLAKTCLAGKDSIKELDAVISMARNNISPSRTKGEPKELLPLFRLCAALAEYRAGNRQKTLDLLDEPTLGGLGHEPQATALLLRAMAAHGLGKNDEAQAESKAADSVFAGISSPTADIIVSSTTIQDWLIAQTLLREAQATRNPN